jgi:hypothetical protein
MSVRKTKKIENIKINLNMKKLTIMRKILIIVLLTISSGYMFAQEVAMSPTTLKQHGYNSSGTATTSENIDSVTVSAVMPYWVAPDANLSATSTTNTFNWIIPSGLGTLTSASVTNLASVTFSTVGTGQIGVSEISGVSGCVGDTTLIDVQVLAKPTATASTFGTVDCPSTATPYNMNVPTFTLTDLASSVKAGYQQIKVTYTLTGPTDNSGTSGTIGTASTTLTMAEGSKILDLSALNGMIDYPGTYTITISNITDRISRKCSVGNAVNLTKTFVVNRRPNTGKIYHTSNM